MESLCMRCVQKSFPLIHILYYYDYRDYELIE